MRIVDLLKKEAVVLNADVSEKEPVSYTHLDVYKRQVLDADRNIRK